MDRNYIVELIKDNRLQDAINALEEAAEGSHLKNDIITISASYSEYAHLNRTAAEDSQVLGIQRAKITKGLLDILDELSPEELARVTPVNHARVATSKAAAATATNSSLPAWLNNKWVIFAGGALALLILLLLLVPAEDPEVAVNAPTSTTTTDMPTNNPPSTSGQNATTGDITEGVSRVKYKGGEFVDDGQLWSENNRFHFSEEKRGDGIIHLYDDSRHMAIQLDLKRKQVRFDDNGSGKYKFLANITSFD